MTLLVIGLVLRLLCFLHFYVTAASKRNAYLLAVVVISLVTILIELRAYAQVTEDDSGASYSTPSCESKTAWKDIYSDGECLMTAMMIDILQNWLLLSVCVCVVIELFLRVMVQAKSFNKLLFVVPVLCVSLIMGLTCMFAGDGMSTMTGTSSFVCIYSNDSMKDVHENTMLTILYSSSIVYTVIIGKCVSTTLSAATKNDNPFTKLWKTYRVLFYIGFVIYLYCLPVFISKTFDEEALGDSFFNWVMCLFEHFALNQPNYVGYCGETAEERVSLGFQIFVISIQESSSIFMLLATMNDSVTSLYLDVFTLLEQKLFGTDYIASRFSGKKMEEKRNVYHSSQGEASTNSTTLESQYEGAEKFKPQSQMYTVDEAAEDGKYSVAPTADDEETKDNGEGSA